MHSNMGELKRKLYRVFAINEWPDMSISEHSKFAYGLALYYSWRDLFLWDYSSGKERKELVKKFNENHGIFIKEFCEKRGINPKDIPIHNPDDAMEVLEKVYLSWKPERLKNAYRNIVEIAARESQEESFESEPIADSRGQFFLPLR